MRNDNPIRVICIDDHPLILAGVRSMLQAETDMLYIGEAANGEEGVAMFRENLPDVTLVERRLEGTSGTEAIATIRR